MPSRANITCHLKQWILFQAITRSILSNLSWIECKPVLRSQSKYSIHDKSWISLVQILCDDSRLQASYRYLTFQTQLPYSVNGRTCDTQRETMNSVERHIVHANRLLIIELARPTTRIICSWNLNLTSANRPMFLYTLTNCKLSPNVWYFSQF